MDLKKSTESTKETSTLHKPNKPLMECIRKFPLIQQFPSTIKEFNSEPWSKLNIKQFSTPSIKDVKNASNLSFSNIPCKKLRIVSSNGKDLGEFNVEVLDKNASKGQIYTITKSNIFKPTSKPIMLTLNPLAKKTLPRILHRQSSVNTVRDKKMKIMPVEKHSFTKNNKFNVSSIEHVTPNKNNQIVDISENIEICNDEISDKKMENSNNKILIPEKKTNQESLDCIANNNRQKHPAIKYNNINILKADQIKMSTLLENKIFSTNFKDMTYKEIAESPFPKVRCKRLVIPTNNIPIHNKVRKRKDTSITKAARNKKVMRSSSKMLNCVKVYKQKDVRPNKKGNTKTSSKNNKSHSRQVGSARRRNNSSQINSKVIHKTKQVRETRTREDIMTIVPSHNSVSFHKNAISTLEHNKYHMTSKERLGHKNSVLDNNAQFVSRSRDIADVFDIDVQSSVQSQNCSKNNSFQKIRLEQWDVIKKAVNSVKDEGLRAQALKALADCTIGIERRVPKHPPEELKSVHDTQVQTTVFGLLDPKFFVLINKDIENIQRIQQITLHEELHKQDLSQDPPLQNNLISDVIQQPTVSSNFNVIEAESYFDIDSFMNQICEENLGALQVQETLSTTKIKCQKIIEQLQKDFELVKKYDEDGMLSIHNAVVKNNIFDVQRYLMVLKQCKESVDIMTMDGMTCLELAIKYDVRGDIVKLLLQSGAQAVKAQPLHESALIIAAKQSSALLPMLVNHISSPKLLDQVDSEGFAALHYCSKNGHVEGVNVLISAGANVNLKDMKSGRTPLFHALESDNMDNRPKVVQRLLQAEAITSITNFAGQPPLPLPNDEKRSTFMMSLRKSTKISLPARYLF